ncbi:MAG TPA: tetraacyldisaccharide 4'-kinase [bacterium]|nr:tetraacyldisaccharide 4'-kinase [bacterium]
MSAAAGDAATPDRSSALRWGRALVWPLLAVLAGVYGALTALRRLAYRRGWLRQARASCPVLSVGNLTAGGSGKTPLVDWLLRAARQAGCRPVAISRGYRNRTRSDVLRVRAAEGPAPDPVAMGDEPALLARRNPEVPVYVARRRTLAARLAALVDRPGLIVLDDGFQHLRLARDLDVVLIDAQQGLGNGWLLPLGPLREPLRAARRAHAVLITKAAPGEAEALRGRIATALGPAVPVFTCDYRPARLRRLDGNAELPPEALHGAEVRLLCGIARPQSFVHSVEALGARVMGLEAHEDHYAWPDDACAALGAALAADSAAAGAPRWLTTEKDAVKLTGRAQPAERLWVLELEVVPDPAAQAFFFDFIARCKVT